MCDRKQGKIHEGWQSMLDVHQLIYLRNCDRDEENIVDFNKEYNGYRYFCIGFLLPSSKLQSFNVNFIRDFNEKINGLTDSSFISDVLIMDDFNYSIRERQVHKHRLFGVWKNCNTEGCNSAENRSSEGKRCKAEENKYTHICDINNLENLNGTFGSYKRREFTCLNNSELG